MKNEELNKSLENLHEELKRADSLDANTLNLLKDILDEIKEIMHRSNIGDVSIHKSILERLKELAVAFESTHPKVSESIYTLTNSLSNFGL